MLHKIIARFRTEPIGVAMPGPRLPQRIRTIVEAHSSTRISRCRIALLVATCATICAAFLAVTLTRAQSSATQDWEKAAGGQMVFEVASVKQNTSGSRATYTNFSWWNGDELPQTGGLFIATNWPLYQYIFFAYKPTSVEQTAVFEALPKWTKSQHFDIEARASGTPTKDQYRLMMQSLLANRFKLAVHLETRVAPAFALVLAKPGKLGPQLRPHVDNPPCADPSTAFSTMGMALADNDGFPKICDRVGPMRPRTRGDVAGWGGRNVTLAEFASSMGFSALSQLGRPLVDRTGIYDKVDLFLEWTPPEPGNPNVTPEMEAAPALEEALRQQLGLKLESTNAPVETMTVDHIEEPTPN